MRANKWSIFACLLICISCGAIKQTRAEDRFAVVHGETSDGFIGSYFNTDPQNINTFRGIIYWQEVNRSIPVTIELEDTETVSSRLKDNEQSFSIKINNGEFIAELVEAEEWPDFNILQYVYNVKVISEGRINRTGMVQITHDPVPLAPLIIMGGAALICTANHVIELYNDNCKSATMKISVFPPKCETICNK